MIATTTGTATTVTLTRTGMPTRTTTRGSVIANCIVVITSWPLNTVMTLRIPGRTAGAVIAIAPTVTEIETVIATTTEDIVAAIGIAMAATAGDSRWLEKSCSRVQKKYINNGRTLAVGER